jgi:hypothetical protein
MIFEDEIYFCDIICDDFLHEERYKSERRNHDLELRSFHEFGKSINFISLFVPLILAF